jgi:hypothetical protein
MGPRCSSAETQVCHRSYIIAAKYGHARSNYTQPCVHSLREEEGNCPQLSSNYKIQMRGTN